MQIHLTAVAFVRNSRAKPIDDNWREIISEVELADHIPTEAVLNLSGFSHFEIIFYFDQADDDKEAKQWLKECIDKDVSLLQG